MLKEKIKEKYQRFNRRILNRSLIGMLFGLSLPLVYCGYSVYQAIKIHDPRYHQYIQMYNSVGILKTKRERIPIPNLPYDSVQVKPYLEEAYKDLFDKRRSLDKTIEIVERELEAFKQSNKKVIQENEILVRNATYGINWIGVISLGIISLSFIYGFLKIKRNETKERQELENEKCQN